MMKKYQVIVNGEKFDVEIEEVGGATAAAPAAQAAVSTPAPAAVAAAPVSTPAAPAPAPAAPKPAASGAANEVVSPLPGTVLNVVAKEGQAVKYGEVVMIVEAMKMENEIVAPESGTITAIHVKKGDSVQAGELLFTMS